MVIMVSAAQLSKSLSFSLRKVTFYAAKAYLLQAKRQAFIICLNIKMLHCR
ncbi:unknown [Prevotella sp. CAG:1058]|nr:unknown [Prevotella sp. CAG:1058]